MKFYIAGTMRGSLMGTHFVNQSYRGSIKSMIEQHHPDAEIIDPFEGCNAAKSNEVDHKQGKKVFFDQNKICRHVDVMVAYLPTSSMGTAIEMWEAYNTGALIITISQMKHNWAIRFLSHYLFDSLTQFGDALRTGSLPLKG